MFRDTAVISSDVAWDSVCSIVRAFVVVQSSGCVLDVMTWSSKYRVVDMCELHRANFVKLRCLNT